MSEQLIGSKYDIVMVIDDTHISRYIAERMLKKCGVAREVILMESALEALDYLRNHKEKLPSLVLLDIRMPEMDGFEFLEKYAQLPPFVHQHCRIFMLSSTIDPKDHEQMSNNPFVAGFIGKPLTRENLSGL